MLIASTSLLPNAGCGLLSKVPKGKHDTTKSYHDGHGLSIEYPDVVKCASPQSSAAQQATTPYSLEDPSTLPAHDMSLPEAVNLAVQQSPVLRTIGGTVVTSPQAATTVYDPGLTAASPNQGAEAALSAFDAQFTQQLFWGTTDQPNNVDRTGFTSAFTPSVSEGTGASYTSELSKQTALGSQFALRHVVDYSRTNQPFRAFSSSFEGWIEAEWRQPLLQGSGTTFNRIAGPTTVPGQYNGVLIGRLNEDVALADFEGSVIGLVSDVEQAYWDLVTAYRILDTAVKGREAALQTFQYQQVRLEVGSGRSDEEAQARSQYYQFQAQVESALGGTNGLYAAEQRLRYLVGLPATDGRLLRPITQPVDAKVVFDWQSALGQSLERRVEVRRQRLAVKRRDLELVAARLNLRPRLDFVGQYRWQGLGDRLIGDTTGGPLDNLYGTIAGGDFQQGRVGVEMNLPVGLRAASLAVAHAKLNVKRERALLDEVELRVSHDLSGAAREISLTYQLLETNYNRYLADLHQVDVLRRRYRDGSDNINFLLQAQRQVVASETEFYRSLANYNLAIRDFHRQKGSLLAYNHVQLAEGPWAAGAAYDAYQIGRSLTPRANPKKVSVPRPLTSGPFDPSSVQDTSGAFSQPADPLPTTMDTMQLEDVQPLPPPSDDQSNATAGQELSAFALPWKN
ncbi:MAG: TolC family protein [Rubripirellula sp.]